MHNYIAEKVVIRSSLNFYCKSECSLYRAGAVGYPAKGLAVYPASRNQYDKIGVQWKQKSSASTSIYLRILQKIPDMYERLQEQQQQQIEQHDFRKVHGRPTALKYLDNPWSKLLLFGDKLDGKKGVNYTALI